VRPRRGRGYAPDVTDERAIDLDRILAARVLVGDRVHRTPMLSSAAAAAVVRASTGARLGDDRLYLKAEHLQRTGSFKPRGMVNRVASLSAEERARGIVTISAGNAAQGYAYAGAAAGVAVTVVMPETANPTKVAATRGYGATVILEGRTTAEAFAALDRIREERGLVLCHPFDDPDVIAGHGAVGLEILEDLPDVDVVVVPIGGGGLISGVAAAIKQRRPATRVIGVEPRLADSMRRSLEAGAPVRVAATSVADGLNAPSAGAWTLDLVRRFVDDVLVLDDDEILAGLRFALERTKQVVEPAGATALAAMLLGRVAVRSGERACVVLSGGNLDLSRVGEFLASAAALPV
jgi:threonine dehydratase